MGLLLYKYFHGGKLKLLCLRKRRKCGATGGPVVILVVQLLQRAEVQVERRDGRARGRRGVGGRQLLGGGREGGRGPVDTF